MVGLDSNPFDLLGSEHSDSDDSGYVDDDSDVPAEDYVDQLGFADTLFGQALLKKANPEGWELVRRKRPAEVSTSDIEEVDQPVDFVRSGYGALVPPGNWREHSEETILQYRQEVGTRPTLKRPRSDESEACHGVRDQMDRFGSWRVQQTPGTIVRHADFHHFPLGNAPQDQGNIVELSNGGQILEKCRFFLIVGGSGDRVLECPIYTYGDKGLRHRNPATWAEYCSIRPLHVSADGFENQSPGNMALDVVWMEWRGEMKESMVVRLSDVRCRNTGTGVVVVAAISSEALKYATKRVVDLVSEAVTAAQA